MRQSRRPTRWAWLICSLGLLGLASFFLYPVLESYTPREPEQPLQPASVEVVEHPAAPTVTPRVKPSVVKPVKLTRGVSTPPQPIRKETPSIPEGIRNRIYGVVPVDVSVRIGAAGNVTHAEILGRPEGLRRFLALQAVDSVRRWKFRPAKRDGKSIPSETVVRFRFHRSATEWN